MIYLIRNFKITVIKVFNEVRRTIHEQSENFKKEIKKNKVSYRKITELKNTITDLKTSNRRVPKQKR